MEMCGDFTFSPPLSHSLVLLPLTFLYLYVPLIRVNKKMRYRIGGEGGGVRVGLGASLRCLIQKAPRVQFPEACESEDQGKSRTLPSTALYPPPPPPPHITLNSESTLQSPIKLRRYVLCTQD